MANLLKYTRASLSKMASHDAIIGMNDALLSEAAFEYFVFLILFFPQTQLEEIGF